MRNGVWRLLVVHLGVVPIVNWWFLGPEGLDSWDSLMNPGLLVFSGVPRFESQATGPRTDNLFPPSWVMSKFRYYEFLSLNCHGSEHVQLVWHHTPHSLMLRNSELEDRRWRNHNGKPHEFQIKKLDPKWVPERAKHSGRKIWHEMKGPWRLSPIEHNPKITNLFSRRAFLVTPRWWRSTWRFPITDHSWNVDIHARKSKRGRRANVKSNNSRQISQVK